MQDMMKNMMNDMWKSMDTMKNFDLTKKMDFMKDFNASKIGLQVLDFQKSTFNNTYNTLLKIQEQSEKIADSFMKDNSVIPAEGRKILDEWKLVFKKGQSELKKSIDESFNKAESFFAEANQPAKAAK
jgi:polyhydroxyalkanoate synthesis regulator phasin